MSVVIMKLRRTNDSELRKARKALRATLILLPLLGIINIFHLFDYPLDGSSTGFAIWAYFTHFFRSFQGVFISSIYCFSNGEVRKAIKKKCARRTWCRFGCIESRRRALPPARSRERHVFAITDDNMELVPVPIRTWACPSTTHMISDIETGISHAELHAVRMDRTPAPPHGSSMHAVRVDRPPAPPHGSSFRVDRPPAPPYGSSLHAVRVDRPPAPPYGSSSSISDLRALQYEPSGGHYDGCYYARSSSTPPHTIPPARRAFVRPGLITRDSRDHRACRSSCF